MADDLIPHTHGAPPRGRQPYPHGKTARFVELVLDAHGADFVKSWLNQHNCDFTSDTIFTTGVGYDRLSKRCDLLAEKAGVTIEICPDVRKRFKAHADLVEMRLKTIGGKK